MRCKKWLAMTLALVLVLLPFGAASGEMEEVILEEIPEEGFVQIESEDIFDAVADEEEVPAAEVEEFVLFDDGEETDDAPILAEDEGIDGEPDVPVEIVEEFSVDAIEALKAVVDKLDGIVIYTGENLTSDLKMTAGTTLRLYADPIADLYPLTGEDLANLAKAFIWTSSDEQVATVDGLGMVTAKKVTERKTVTITASAIGTEGELTGTTVSDTIDITVVPVATGIVIRDDEGNPVTEVTVADPIELHYQVLPEGADQTVEITDITNSSPKYVELVPDTEAQTLTLRYVDNGFSTITVAKGALSASVRVIAAKEGEPVAATIEGPATVEVGLGKKIKLAENVENGGWGVRAFPSGEVLTYKSKDPKIATVSAAGVVKGVKAGSTTITVKCNGAVDWPIKVNVKAKPVTKVTVSQKSVLKGETVTLTAGITPSTASKLVRWESDDTSVATVTTDTDNGIAKKVTVTGVDYGPATITAYAMDGSGKKGSADVTVCQPATGVEITAANGANTVGVGKALQLTATLSGAEPEADPDNPIPVYSEGLTWESSNKKIATVSSTGKVTGVKAGTVTITATEKSNGIKSEIEVTVKAPITSVKIAGDAEIDLTNPVPLTLTAAIKPTTADPNSIIWKSSDEALATVAADPTDPLKATVTAVDPPAQGGTVTITAMATDGSKLKAEKTVTLKLPVTDMNVTNHYGDAESDVIVAVGKTVKLSSFVGVEILPAGATNKKVSYKPSNGNVTVSSKGEVKGVKAGKNSVITITSKDNPEVSREVTVHVAPVTTKITLGVEEEAYSKFVPPTPTGMTLHMTATAIAPTGASDKLVWSSSDETIATVGKYTGVVTTVPDAEGIVKITATATDGSGVAKAYKFYAMNPVTEFALTGNAVNSEGTSIVQVPVGKAVTITADGFNADASDTTLTWTSKSTKIATVSGGGKVKGVKAGTTTITATATYSDNGEGKTVSKTIKVVVKAANTVATGISFKNSDDTAFTDTYMVAGQSRDVKAVVKPAAALQNVTWTSSDETVATVTAGADNPCVATIEAVAKGPVTITAKAVDGSKKSNSFTLTVGPAPANMRIAGLHSITKGTTTTLIPVVKDIDGNVIQSDVVWESEDENIATIDAKGVVTGEGVGTTVITATAIDGDGVHAFFPIDVTPKATGVQVCWNGKDWSTKTITVSKSLVAPGRNTLQLNAHVLPDNRNATVTWKSSDTTIATVNANGIVTFKAKTGTAKITATVKDNTKVTSYVNIKVVAGNVGVAVSSPLDVVAVDGTCAMSATLTNSSNGVYWTSSDPAIATVDENGVVTAIAPGEVTITATSIDDPTKEAPVPLTIVRKIDELAFDMDEVRVPWGYGDTTKTEELRDHLFGDGSEIDDARLITWTSDNPDVATVDANGVVTLKKVGEANITATLNDGSENVSITIPVTVYEAVKITNLAPIDDQNVTYEGHDLNLVAVIQDQTIADWILNWESLTPAKISVEQNGEPEQAIATGVAAGKGIIKVTAVNPQDEADTVAAIIEIDVLQAITKFEINAPAEGWLYADTQLVMTLNTEPAGAYVGGAVWEILDDSPNPGAAEIDPNTGAITAKEPGTVYITATFTYPDGVPQTATYQEGENTLPYYPLTINPDFEWAIDSIEDETVIQKATITAYNGNAATVTIPAYINGVPVTQIGGKGDEGTYKGAFEDNTAITSVSIPNSIEVIGESAFSGCSSLSTMTPY